MNDRERELRQQVEANPNDPEALAELAREVGRRRDRKLEALELWQRRVEVAEPAEVADALMSLARAQVEARREAEAIETLRRTVDTETERAEAFELLGELQRREGAMEEAVEAFRRAAELQPNAVQPRIALLMCLNELGRKNEVQQVAAAIHEIGSGDPAVAALLRRMLQG
jgi:tetratricopeptide (TPR) repeat protein